jgi:hypothetical protein
VLAAGIGCLQGGAGAFIDEGTGTQAGTALDFTQTISDIIDDL